MDAERYEREQIHRQEVRAMVEDISNLIRAAVEAERERCAKIADEWADGDHSGGWAVAQNIADAIRTPSPATSE